MISNKYIPIIFVFVALLTFSCRKGGEPVPKFNKATSSQLEDIDVFEFIPDNQSGVNESQPPSSNSVKELNYPVIGGDDGEDDDCDNIDVNEDGGEGNDGSNTSFLISII